MPVLSRKRAAQVAAEAEAADTRGRMLQLARPAAAVRAAVPMAKTTGIAARRGASNAAAWAAPRVSGARAWTAPRIERSGLTIQDTIAPKICEVLAATARRVDVTPPRVDVPASRRRWRKALAATAMLAAGGAAAAIMLRRRRADRTCEEAPGEAVGADSSGGGVTGEDPPAAA